MVYGSGFIRIRKELQDCLDVDFVVEEIGGGILVTFNKSVGKNGSVNGGVNEVFDFIRPTFS